MLMFVDILVLPDDQAGYTYQMTDGLSHMK